MAGEIVARTLNLDLGNAAEVSKVVINASHITYVKLTGQVNSMNRRMEVYLANGAVISMSFDEPDHAEKTFTEVIDTLNHTIPDHLA
jgi:hypothetical protein